MSRSTLKAAVEKLESDSVRNTAIQEHILLALQRITGTPDLPVYPGNSVPPVNATTDMQTAQSNGQTAAVGNAIANQAPAVEFVTESTAAGLKRQAANTGIHGDGTDDFIADALPTDNPQVKGPVWSSKVLRNKYGTFPAHHRRKNSQTGQLDSVQYEVSPSNRSNFMAAAQGRQFGFEVTLAVPDGKGGESIVRYPAVCNLASKQFSSFDHGLYGKVDGVTLTLPDGSEYVLDGQVTLQLKKRMS